MGRFQKGQVAWNKGLSAPWAKNLPHAFKKGEHAHVESEFKKGIDVWNKGKKWSIDVINKIKRNRKGKMVGEQHHMWLKDRSKLSDKRGRRSGAYENWKKQVYSRDDHRCKINNKDCSGKVEAHHILGWKEHKELRFIVSNGITLCTFHHPRKRDLEMKMSPYFQDIINNNLQHKYE